MTGTGMGYYGTNWQAIDRCVGANIAPVHPGELLSDWLADHEVRQHDLAQRLGLTDPYVGMLRAGTKNVGPKMALRLEQVTEVKAEIWLHMQMAYTLAQLRTTGPLAGAA